MGSVSNMGVSQGGKGHSKQHHTKNADAGKIYNWGTKLMLCD